MGMEALRRERIREFFIFNFWKTKVKRLYKSKGNTFSGFLLTSLGWAKYLGLDRSTVEEYLKSFGISEEELRLAWDMSEEKVIQPSEAKLERFVNITLSAVSYVQERGKVPRQELRVKVFKNLSWLTDLVMGYLEKEGVVRSYFEAKGKGKIKLYAFGG